MIPEPRWPASLYDGQTADRRPVSVVLEPEGIRILGDDGTSELWLTSELRQSRGSFSGDLIRIERGVDPAQALIVDQPGFAAALRRAHPRAPLRGARSSRSLLAVGLGSIGAIVLLYVFGVNAAADWLARRAPPSWERTLGEGVAERMAPADRQCQDSSSTAAVAAVLQRLVAGGPPTPYAFRVVIVRDSAINAFAAPGGFVAVHSGLIAAAESPDELAGVLAHEAQHVLLRHSTRAIFREIPLQVAITLLFGGSGVEGLASMVGSLGALGYRRDDEAEADREGMRLMHAAGLDGHAMVSFMRTLERKNASAPRLLSYVSSHPHTADRVAQLERLAAAGPAPASPAMDASVWQHVKRACGVTGPGSQLETSLPWRSSPPGEAGSGQRPAATVRR